MKFPRFLCVVDINDHCALSEETYFDIKHISSFNLAQRALSSQDDGFRPDILLCDVSFDSDDEVGGARLKDDPPITPIGPILALPYLRSRDVIGFAPYSGHITDDELLRAPYFLLPMALIASKLKGRTFTSTHLRGGSGEDSLGRFLVDLASVGNAKNALSFGLRAYRRSFKVAVRNKRVRVLNASSIAELFKKLRTSMDLGEDRATIPASAGIEFVGPSGHDFISLHSFFADRLCWVNRKVKMSTLKNIESIWCKIMRSDVDPVFEMAYDIMRILGLVGEKQGQHPKREEEENASKNAWQIISYRHRFSNEELRQEILRLCVLFANALALQEHPYKRSSIADMIANGHLKVYYSWFGQRANVRSKRLVPFFQPPNGKKDYSECFLCEGSKISIDDDMSIRIFLLAAKIEKSGNHYNLPYETLPEDAEGILAFVNRDIGHR